MGGGGLSGEGREVAKGGRVLVGEGKVKVERKKNLPVGKAKPGHQ